MFKKVLLFTVFTGFLLSGCGTDSPQSPKQDAGEVKDGQATSESAKTPVESDTSTSSRRETEPKRQITKSTREKAEGEAELASSDNTGVDSDEIGANAPALAGKNEAGIKENVVTPVDQVIGGDVADSEKSSVSSAEEAVAPESKPASPPPAESSPAVKEDKAKTTSATTEKFLSQPLKKSEIVGGLAGKPLADIRAPSEPVDRENYETFEDNPIKRVSENPVSTFSIDVDTGSYTNVRRMLNNGRLPRRDAVRVEEMINYFSYNYPLPESRTPPFKVTTEIAPTPWNEKTHLLHIGIKGFEIKKENLPPSNLVFLIDVSGSMRSANKLDLLKSSLKLLTQQMSEKDRVTLVVYAGASGLVLEPTPGNQTATITAALDRLRAGGSTNGGAGIELAYAMAQQAFIKEGINRVLLATDGDFNVGTTNFEALKNMIEEKRKTGISLTTLGFGMGNYNDHLMEQLADAGNGNYAYIDSLNEAQKVLVDQVSSTLNTIAKDVKIQIEFNPANVAEYRLIGYVNRKLKREDFDNDKIDAGEIGAGHTVTALYEIALAGSEGQRLKSLRYGEKAEKEVAHSNELVFLRLRYKQPDGDTSKLLEWPIKQSDILESADSTSVRFRFSAAVAAFGQLLRGGKYTEKFTYDDVLALARGARGDDPFGYRGEFLKLVNLTKSLSSGK